MKRKNIDTMREIRLWAKDIIIPLAGVAMTALTIPEIRSYIGDEFKNRMDKFKRVK